MRYTNKAASVDGFDFISDQSGGRSTFSVFGNNARLNPPFDLNPLSDEIEPAGAPKSGWKGSGGGKGGGNDGSGGGSGSAPTDISLSNTVVDENSAGGTLVGDLSATDTDKRERFRYELTDDAGGRFYVDGGRLMVSEGADLDFETQPEHVVTILVTDKSGNTYSESFAITLRDIYKAPQIEMPYYVDALLGPDSERWNYGSDPGTGVSVTFAFLTEVPDYYSAFATERTNFSAFNLTQKNATLSMLDSVEEFADIQFVQTTDVNNAQMTFGNTDLGPNYGAWAYMPSLTDPRGGDLWINNYYNSQLNPVPGNFAYLTLLHETGHTLGLRHPGDYDVSGGSGASYLPAGEDNYKYTVMSYYEHPDMAPTTPQTMALYDMAALQHLYGANTNHAAGDDVYDFSNAFKLVETIWDAGGYDTFSAETSDRRAILDLRDGSFSSVGTYAGGLAADNIAIGFGVEIEAAIGSTRNDTLIGNGLNNTLTGGAGADAFVFTAAFGDDVITDFEAGIDKINLADLGIGFDDLTIADDLGGAIVAYGGDAIQLVGVSAAAVGAEDFVFA